RAPAARWITARRVKLAVFDLDGTITRHDTLIQYVLGYLKTRPWRVFGFLLGLPAVLKYAVGAADRGALKAAVIRWTLGGSTRAEIDAWTARFVPHLLEKGVFQEAIKRIAEHRRNGDTLVLMSASPDLYVPAIGQKLGFAEVTCTGIRWNGDRLDGSLTTPNCRGEEKAVRFASLQARHPGVRSVAYGNAASDLPHLRLADRGVLVNADRAARREAARLDNVVCERWK
ncbi:MAG TPA: HAD-IB family hydrolase, partial [Steroidobacteraceae bacterium]|nr:HAD-IB family hydrolase [Steroidobacteraceae bacterium]